MCHVDKRLLGKASQLCFKCTSKYNKYKSTLYTTLFISSQLMITYKQSCVKTWFIFVLFTNQRFQHELDCCKICVPCAERGQKQHWLPVCTDLQDQSKRAKNSFISSYNKFKVGLWTSLPVHHYNIWCFDCIAQYTKMWITKLVRNFLCKEK